MTVAATPFAQSFFHGSKVSLETGDLIGAGYRSNYGAGKAAAFAYLTATLDPAVWAAELAAGEGPGRIYVVEPSGPVEDDPNVTDQKFPGNPTMSYRTRDPLRIVGEVIGWVGHSSKQIEAMQDHLAELKRLGVEAIED